MSPMGIASSLRVTNRLANGISSLTGRALNGLGLERGRQWQVGRFRASRWLACNYTPEAEVKVENGRLVLGGRESKGYYPFLEATQVKSLQFAGSLPQMQLISQPLETRALSLFFQGVDFERIDRLVKARNLCLPQIIKAAAFRENRAPEISEYLRTKCIETSEDLYQRFVNDVFRAIRFNGRRDYTTEDKVTRTVFGYVLEERRDLLEQAGVDLGQISGSYQFADFASRQQYLDLADKLLRAIHKQPLDNRTKFFEYVRNNKKDVSFASRYDQITHFIISMIQKGRPEPGVVEKSKEPIAETQASLQQEWQNRKQLRILDLGGAPFTYETGALADVKLYVLLKEAFPDLNLDIVVTDIAFPLEFYDARNEAEGVLRSDPIEPAVTYHQYNLLDEVPPELRDSFDVVICNRVLKQPCFLDNESNYKRARTHIFDCARPGGLIFLDPGGLEVVEVTQKLSENQSASSYDMVTTLTDPWFSSLMFRVFTNLDLFSDPIKYFREHYDRMTFSERSAIMRYHRSLLDVDKWLTNILLRSSLPVSVQHNERDFKDHILPDWFAWARNENPHLMEEFSLLITNLCNPYGFSLKGVKRINEILDQGRIGLRVFLALVITSKLETIFMPAEEAGRTITLSEYLAQKAGLSGDFFTNGGIVEKVVIRENSVGNEEYEVTVYFLSNHIRKTFLISPNLQILPQD